MVIPPNLDQIRAVAQRISPYVVRTPTVPYYGRQLDLAPDTRVWLKLELMQHTGSFKPRGALNVMMQLTEAEKAHGVTTFSAGNHAIATAYAAQILGISAKVVMPESANPVRVERCLAQGAQIVYGQDIAALMSIVDRLQADEQRALVHPFEGMFTTAGTATVGLELCTDTDELDVVIVPVGGGGLISGVAAAVRQINPSCVVYGVEPAGASGMRDSLRQGAPLAEVAVQTIADSLGAPMHKDYSFGVIQQTVEDVVTVSDSDLRAAMRVMFGELKLAVEPAGAAALAALIGPLREEVAGKRVGLVVCGSNIDLQTYTNLVL